MQLTFQGEGRLHSRVNLSSHNHYFYRAGIGIEFLSTDIGVAVSLTLCSLCVWEMRCLWGQWEKLHH